MYLHLDVAGRDEDDAAFGAVVVLSFSRGDADTSFSAPAATLAGLPFFVVASSRATSDDDDGAGVGDAVDVTAAGGFPRWLSTCI